MMGLVSYGSSDEEDSPVAESQSAAHNEKPKLPVKDFRKKTEELRRKLFQSRPKFAQNMLQTEDVNSSDDSDDQSKPTPRRLQTEYNKKSSLLNLLPPSKSTEFVFNGPKSKSSSEFIPKKNTPSEQSKSNLAAQENFIKSLSSPAASSYDRAPAPMLTDMSATLGAQKKSQALKPGQRILQDDLESTSSDSRLEDANWNSETFIPAPERKRLKLARQGALERPDLETVIQVSGGAQTITQEDLTQGGRTELMKNVTADINQYRQIAQPDSEPGKLASRKHQITWLAYRAQEEEFDLKERWARTKSNQAANRAKYGF